jgi:hypothetical protein
MAIIQNDLRKRIDSIQDFAATWSDFFEARAEALQHPDDKQLSLLLKTFSSAVEILATAAGITEDRISKESILEGKSPLPSVGQSELVSVIEADWNVVSRICIQRLHSAQEPADDNNISPYQNYVKQITDGDLSQLLRAADVQANNLYRAFDGVLSSANPLVLFDTSYHITRYKLTPYPLIAIPLRFREVDMQPQALAHEIGHYIYSHSSDLETYPEPAHEALKAEIPDIVTAWYLENRDHEYMPTVEQLRKELGDQVDSSISDDVLIPVTMANRIIYWLEEIIADMFGVLLAGPSYIDTAINLTINRSILESNNGGLSKHKLLFDDKAHPPLILRPFIAISTLQALASYIDSIAEEFDGIDAEMSATQFKNFAADRWYLTELVIGKSIFECKPENGDENGSDINALPHSLLCIMMQLMTHVVGAIFNGYMDGDDPINTWHKHPDHDLPEPFGIGHLLRKEAYIALMATLQANSNQAAYPTHELKMIDSHKDDIFFRWEYNARVAEHEDQVINRDAVNVTEWKDSMKRLVKNAEDLHVASVEAQNADDTKDLAFFIINAIRSYISNLDKRKVAKYRTNGRYYYYFISTRARKNKFRVTNPIALRRLRNMIDAGDSDTDKVARGRKLTNDEIVKVEDDTL